MSLSGAVIWWIVTGILVALELATGTFFLLMLAIGTLVGALATHLHASFSVQLIAASLAGGGAVFWWYRRRRQLPASPPVQENPDAILDIGSRVVVASWEADGTARVAYRGSTWTVRWTGDGPPQSGELVIRRLKDNCLLVDRIA